MKGGGGGRGNNAALELLSDIGVCVVTVPSEWRHIVIPCYALLCIPWMEDEGDQVDIQQVM